MTSPSLAQLFDAKLGDGTRVLLKEYIGDEPKALAGRELDTYELLYKRATDAGQRVPSQVGQLLGVMTPDASFATEAFRTEWSRALPNVPPPAQNAVWLVFQWEGLRTVAGFPSFPQERSFFDFDGRGALADRRKFVKAVCAQTLEALRWLHGQGVVHRSLGSSSIILSTYDQREPPAIKLIDLGFAVTATALGPDDIKAASESLHMGSACPCTGQRMPMHQRLYTHTHVRTYACTHVPISAPLRLNAWPRFRRSGTRRGESARCDPLLRACR